MKRVAIVAAVFLLGGTFVWYQLFAFTSGPVEFSNRASVRVTVTEQVGDERIESSLSAGHDLSRMSKGLFREPPPSVTIRHPHFERAVSRAQFEAMLSSASAHIVVVVIEEAGVRFVTLDAKRKKTPIQPTEPTPGSRT